MRMSILTVRSRGDGQPYLALGSGLRTAGHQVRLATHRPFEPEVRAHGLEAGPLRDVDARRCRRGDMDQTHTPVLRGELIPLSTRFQLEQGRIALIAPSVRGRTSRL
jgi:UDP:flavonoid glycosyltransferase YjiC (YdhE family)